ncbi:MAG: hypothetical protein R2785_02365 [Flavobacteriaceae bacterium]
MKKILLLITLSIFCFGFSQNNSIPEIGKTLTESLSENNLTKFKSILFSKEMFLEIMAENIPKETDEKKKKEILETIDKNYESQFTSAFETNFSMLQLKLENFDINLDKLNYEIVKVDNPDAHKNDPKIIHASISHPKFKHLYFYVNEYKQKWYLSMPKIDITDSELKIY